MKINPLTYSEIFNFTRPVFADLFPGKDIHEVGKVCATMLFEVYWNLVENSGFEPDLY